MFDLYIRVLFDETLHQDVPQIIQMFKGDTLYIVRRECSSLHLMQLVWMCGSYEAIKCAHGRLRDEHLLPASIPSGSSGGPGPDHSYGISVAVVQDVECRAH